MSNEREQFEAWWDDPTGGDGHTRKSIAWLAWQARAALSVPPAGYVLVSVDALREACGTIEGYINEQEERLRGYPEAIYRATRSERETLDQLNAALAAAPQECRCNLRTKMVGDGCAICNPNYATLDPKEGEQT